MSTYLTCFAAPLLLHLFQYIGYPLDELKLQLVHFQSFVVKHIKLAVDYWKKGVASLPYWWIFFHDHLCGRSNAMRQFLQHYADQILGVLSGFDRVRLRGVLRMFGAERGVVDWLHQAGIPLKDFLTWAEGMTNQLRRRTEEDAKAAGRPVEYLVGKVDKEEHVARIRAKHGVAKNGLVAVLSTLEMGTSYELQRYRDTGRCVLYRKPRKCLYYYHYWDDGRFGLTQVRLQTYFPFHVHVVMNGREWLARQLDLLKIGYVRQDNCFIEIAERPKRKAGVAAITQERGGPWSPFQAITGVERTVHGGAVDDRE
jgi:hypothetical protein